MSNDGQAEIATIQESAVDDGWTLSLPFIGCAGVAVVVALFIGIRLFGVISVLIFIPDPPLPDEIDLISHENTAYGVDTWTYSSSQSVCEVVTFYESQSRMCDIPAGICETRNEQTEVPIGERISCSGTEQVSIFGYRWDVEIYRAIRDSKATTLMDVQRIMQWNGPIEQEAN